MSLQVRDKPPVLIMQHRGRSGALQALSAVLGEEDLAAVDVSAPVMTVEEAESLNRIQAMLTEKPVEAEAPVRRNPYFTREDR